MSRDRKKPQTLWRRLAVGIAVIAVIGVIASWYRQQTQVAQPVAVREASTRQSVDDTRPKPVSHGGERPDRERGPRP